MSFKNFIVALLLTITSLFTIHNPASAATNFSDVSSSAFYYKQVQYLVDQKVISGYTEKGKTIFKPNQEVTRAEVATMVVLAKKKTGITSSKYNLTDVPTKAWYAKYVNQAIELGYMDVWGGKGTEFKPNEKVSRQEMSKILALAFNLNVSAYEKYDVPFFDVDRNLYHGYIAAVYYNGLGAGSSLTKFEPRENVTRATFSTFMARGMNSAFKLETPATVEKVAANASIEGQVSVNTNGLNIRSTPNFTSTANNKLGTLSTGAVVNYYEETSSYYKINYNGLYGYIYKTYANVITPGNVENPPEEVIQPEPIVKPETGNTTGLVGFVTVNSLNVRAQASASSERLGAITRGKKVSVQNITGNWAKITFGNQTGYVSKTYLRLKNVSGAAVKGRIIVLDPGHGGRDPGAVSKDGTSTAEKAIVLNVANKLKAMLEKDGAIVKMTRTGDTFPTLEERVAFAKKNYGEMFVSIHVNSATSESANGTETFYSISGNDNETEDAKLAKYINNQIVSNASMRDRGVKRADYYVIRNVIMPAVLIELGFISNRSDLAKLKDSKYVNIYAQSIYNGVVRYYND